MCGISGLVSEKNLSEADLVLAKRMNDALFLRGPDGEGYYQDEKVSLGMRRLSIIDISGASQPLYGTSKEVVVLFNGEIYNYLELRKDLEREGHLFHTQGDGEVIPHLYEKYGCDFVHRLRGMFAISLLDRRSGKLFLFRDRMGEKPIYYQHTESRFIYSSEMKSLLSAIPAKQRVLSPESVDLYLHYQFVPEPRTILKNIFKVPAGHYLELDLKSLNFEVKKYWEFSDAPPVECADPVKRVREMLDSIMKIIGRSDVPVGIALSGGVDSSTVAALFARENQGRDLARAFTVGYEGAPATDERKQARAMADRIGIPIDEVELRTSDFVEYFPTLVSDMDDPVADIASYGIYSVMKAARNGGVKVLLNGVGADEIFWGYPWVSKATEESVQRSKHPGFSHLSFYDQNRDYQYAEKFSAFPALAGAEYKSSGSEEIPIQVMDRLTKGWLFADPVALGDRLSMRNSVELRSPFLDHELVELMVGLNKARPDLYLQPPKQLLKEAVRGLVPDVVLDRPKQGFTPPATRWRLAVIRKYGPLLWDGYLVREKIFSKSRILRLFAPSRPVVFYLYKLILLELWCRQFLDETGERAS